MTKTVKLTNGNYLSGDERQAVLDMVHNHQEKTTYEGKTITLVRHFKGYDEVEIVVEVSE